jgi:hypothetical protein
LAAVFRIVLVHHLDQIEQRYRCVAESGRPAELLARQSAEPAKIRIAGRTERFKR